MPQVAATSLAIIGLANIAGSLTAGALGNHVRMKMLLFWMYFTRALAVLAYMALPKTEWTFYIFAAVLGATWLATVPPTAGLTAKLFGTRYLATLFGLTLLSHQVGGFFGAWLGGIAVTQTGSYAVDVVGRRGAGARRSAGEPADPRGAAQGRAGTGVSRCALRWRSGTTTELRHGRHGRRQSGGGHRRGRRHRPRHRARAGRRRRQGGGQRHRHLHHRRRQRRRPGAAGGPRDPRRRWRSGCQHRQRGRRAGGQPHRHLRARPLRPHRRRRQQRRHPARPHLPQDERRRVGRRDQGAPVRQLPRQPRRGQPLPRARQRRLRAHDQHVGA